MLAITCCGCLPWWACDGFGYSRANGVHRQSHRSTFHGHSVRIVHRAGGTSSSNIDCSDRLDGQRDGVGVVLPLLCIDGASRRAFAPGVQAIVPGVNAGCSSCVSVRFFLHSGHVRAAPGAAHSAVPGHQTNRAAGVDRYSGWKPVGAIMLRTNRNLRLAQGSVAPYRRTFRNQSEPLAGCERRRRALRPIPSAPAHSMVAGFRYRFARPQVTPVNGNKQ